MKEKNLDIIGHTEGHEKGRVMQKYALISFLESIVATKTGRLLGTTFGHYFGQIGFSCITVDSKRKLIS